MMKHWVVAANSSTARFFETPGLLVPLTERLSISNEEARLREQEINTDRGGKFNDEGPGAHGYGVRDTATKKVTQDFARRVATEIERARGEGAFEHLSLVATPEFLGMLRKHLSSATQQAVIESVSKDLADMDAERIRSALSRLNP